MDTKSLELVEGFTSLELSQDQKEALTSILKWLKDPEADQHKTLMGFAGTGKTTLLNEIAQFAMEERINAIFTAPTNKAVKVLMSRIDYKPDKFARSSLYSDKTNSQAFSTIHSLLNIKPKKEGTKEIFEPVKWNRKDISQYDLVVLDECSMVSEKLLGYLDEQLEEHPNTKVLFCGDPAQLQPVNEEKSKCFDFNPEMLTTIIRHGDVIAKTSKKIRGKTNFIGVDEILSPPDISMIDLPTLVSGFSNFREDPDKFRMICWTNDQVKYWNYKLRIADYGRKIEEPFIEGDIIIANKPCEDPDNQERMLMANSEEAIVVKVDEQPKCWELLVEKYSGGQVVVRKLKDEFKKNHKKHLATLAKKKEWTEYWYKRKMYHDIRHCYALTAHKSQGSTFNNVVIDIKDMNRNFDEDIQYEERNQLLYVAMTRASEKVYIY